MRNIDVFVVNADKTVHKELFNLDLDEALDTVGHGRYNYLVLLAACTLQLAAVVDMVGFSVVVPAANCDLNLSLHQSSLLSSVPFAGFIFSILWGYYADTRGRRSALLLSSAFGFVFSALSSFSNSFIVMLVLKFMGCSFSSASITLTFTYLGECTRPKERNRYLMIMGSFSMAADFVCFILAYLILQLDFNIPIPLLNTYRPWRLYSLVMSSLLGAGTVMMFVVKESPKFLANRGDHDKALEVLKGTFKINGGKEEDFKIKSLIGGAADKEQRTSFWSSVVKQTVPIFKPPMLWRTIQLFYILAVCCATNNVFFMWFPTIVNSIFNSDTYKATSTFCEKLTFNTSTFVETDNSFCADAISNDTLYVGMGFSFIFTVVNLMASLLASHRKIVMMATFVIAAVSGTLLDLVRNDAAALVFYTIVQMTGVCIGHAGSYFVDVYPTSYRGLGTSLGMLFARIVCLGGVNLVGGAIIGHCRATFIGWSVFILGGVVAAVFLPHDKKNEKHKMKP